MYITLEELNAILDASREKEMRDHRFQAALAGVDLDKQMHGDPEDRVEEMKRKLDAMNQGMSEDEYEFNDLGLDFEEED